MVKRRMGKLKHAPPQHHTPVTPFPYHWPANALPVEAEPKEREVAFGKTSTPPATRTAARTFDPLSEPHWGYAGAEAAGEANLALHLATFK